LATPSVKKKNEMYYGSPAGSKSGDKKPSATLGNNGIGKVGGPLYLIQLKMLILDRVSYCQNLREIHTLRIQVLAQHARPRLMQGKHTVRSAHTRQMVCNPFQSTVVSAN
jgi:hypothetical protein